MQYMIDLTPHFEELARAVTFDVQPFGQIELEALMLDVVEGAPEGMLTFMGTEISIHPVLLAGALPAFSNSLASLLYLDELVAPDPAAWTDAGHTAVGSALLALVSEGARKLMVWSTNVLSADGYCPLQVLMQSMNTGESFDQVKTRYLFKHQGLMPITVAN